VTVTWEGVAVTVIVLGAPVIHTAEHGWHPHSQAGKQLGKVPGRAGVLVARDGYYVS
jgi:hypothetical protein